MEGEGSPVSGEPSPEAAGEGEAEGEGEGKGMHAQTQKDKEDDDGKKDDEQTKRKKKKKKKKTHLRGCRKVPPQWSSKPLLGAFSFDLEPAKAGRSGDGCEKSTRATSALGRPLQAFGHSGPCEGFFRPTDSGPMGCASTSSADILGARSPDGC